MTLEAPPVATTRRVPELEGLRALLALWVLAFHVLTISGWWQRLPAVFRNIADGANAVEVFILLSGFVITELLLSTQETYPAFLLRRYARLMPVFLVCLAAALAAQWLGYVPIRYVSSEFVPLLAANLALLQGAIPEQWIHGASGALLHPAWSISLEWQFYLVAPFLVPLLAKGGHQIRRGERVLHPGLSSGGTARDGFPAHSCR